MGASTGISRTREGSEFLLIFFVICIHHNPRSNMTITGQDWLTVIPTAGAIGLLVYLAVSKFQSSSSSKDTIVNRSIKKDKEKVVDSFDIEDLGDSEAFCRCWRSKKFPYCDGSHNNHNKETGDNVGPLCLSKKMEGS